MAQVPFYFGLSLNKTQPARAGQLSPGAGFSLLSRSTFRQKVVNIPAPPLRKQAHWAGFSLPLSRPSKNILRREDPQTGGGYFLSEEQ